MTTTTTTERKTAGQPIPPADGKGELRDALKILDWIIDSLEATYRCRGMSDEMYCETQVCEIEPGKWYVQIKSVPDEPWRNLHGPFSSENMARGVEMAFWANA